MKRFSLLLMMVLFSVSIMLAQSRTITGTITDDSGETLIGATVHAKGTTVGTVTDIDGKYSIDVSNDITILVFSYTGFSTQEMELGASNVIDITLDEGLDLSEIVVTGVAAGTSRKKLSFSLSKLDEAQLQEVPGTSPAAAIQGKVAGATVVSATGTPGSAPSIRLRGYSGLTGSQSPLILLDNVILEGTLADVNMEDVKSIEIAKGAAASALYGSRAANGVIVITTNRGAGGNGTKVKYRGEFGFSQLANEMKLATHHAYKLAPNAAPNKTHTEYDQVTFNDDGIALTGARALDDDHYADNDYGFVNNPYDLLYQKGNFSTNYVSVSNSSDKTNFLTSFQRQKQEGIILGSQGFNRNNIRFNLDHQISDKLFLSSSNMIINSKEDRVGGTLQGGTRGGPFFNILFVEPDTDLLLPNEEDGSPHNVDALVWTNQANPLYAINQVDSKQERSAVLHSTNLKYEMTDWLSLDALYSIEKRQSDIKVITPKGTLQAQSALPGTATPGLGSITNFKSQNTSQKFQASATVRKSFEDLNTTARFAYLVEDTELLWSFVNGQNLGYGGITSLANAENVSAASGIQSAKAINYSGIIDLDYKDRYIASVLLRRDGSSLFGANERWQNYFRASGAYRISKDLKMKNIDEMKIFAAYGTAGIRPIYAAQYETYFLTPGGTAQAAIKGNENLKPSNSREIEIGLDLEMFKKFSFNLVYSRTKVEDSFWQVNLPASLSGFPGQWQNIGDLDSKNWEATLGINLLQTNDINLSTNFTFSTGSTVITKLNIPPTQTGTNNAFYFREDEVFGTVYGRKFLTSLSEMSNQLDDGETIADYELNSDGYVVPAGTQGTVGEIPVRLDANLDGNPDLTVIGDINPDFNMSWGTNFSYKDLSVYMLWSLKKGGDVYWQTGQWIYREQRSADFDQSAKADGDKKTVDYYAALYDVNNTNSHFIRDGSYIKLREFSIYYNLGSMIKNKVSFIRGMKIGLVGRNLLTISDYPGFDPEVGRAANNGASSGILPGVNGVVGNGINWGFDGFGYPNFRTVTGSIQLTF